MYILTLVSCLSERQECSLSLDFCMLDLIIIGNGNADISRYFVPFYLSTCAVCDLFVYIKLLKTECDYNCKRWITRFAGRWRTQLAALSGVKCRTRRALDFRTHIAASGLSRGFVCLRVGMKLNTLYKSGQSSMPNILPLLYSTDFTDTRSH